MNNMNILKIEPSNDNIEETEQFDSSYGCKFIVAVDVDGTVSILSLPNIHYGFFDNGNSPEDIGLPFEVDECSPGVYEWTCNYEYTHDWESGACDGGEFVVIEEKLLWCPDGKVNESRNEKS